MLLKQPSHPFWVWLVKLTSQANLFHYIVQKEGEAKHIAMYYERRFTNSGYSAASKLQSLLYLCMLTKQVIFEQPAYWDCSNVPWFRISDHQLHMLAYFTHMVTLPFLYFLKVNSQNGLLEMFPHLFNDLKHSTIDTLREYWVQYPHVQQHVHPTNNKCCTTINQEDVWWHCYFFGTTSWSRVWFW